MYVHSYENIPKRLLIEQLSKTEQELKKYQERLAHTLHSNIDTAQLAVAMYVRSYQYNNLHDYYNNS